MKKKFLSVFLAIAIILPMSFTASVATASTLAKCKDCSPLNFTGDVLVFINNSPIGTHTISYSKIYICGTCDTTHFIEDVSRRISGSCSYVKRDAGHSGSVHRFNEVCGTCGYLKTSGSIPCPGNPCVQLFTVPIDIETFNGIDYNEIYENDISTNYTYIVVDDIETYLKTVYGDNIVVSESIDVNEDCADIETYLKTVYGDNVIISESVDVNEDCAD